MPPRTMPSQRQKRLGAEVRKLRTAAGMTAEYAAALLGTDRAKLSNIESGIRNISAERVRTLATHCNCPDEEYVAALVAYTTSTRGHWWDDYRGRVSPGLLDIAELEWHSTGIKTIQTVHVPGLLQTEAYARSIFAEVLPELPRLEIELRVAHRMARQQVLDREQPIDYVSFVHEAALRMRFGGRRTTRQQLDALLAASERDHITVRVIPVERGSFPGAGHALLYSEGAVPQLDTAQLDSAHGPEFLHSEAQLAKYRAHVEWMDSETLSAKASRDLIHAIISEL
ncbi:helix-turn-helix transcriptional regulator [Streptomyces harbinensis]|uniref:helix-turn-helix domain-containing protein n=1 Tax=Streptomyces harbinensis TaxID=1176198 RepID=UPI0015911DCA|nr:helix-turn-helix transcriptional regulator [Streptomyces harbinensis]QKV71578.1 helix-turn-helix transcriptional regulator [Streptomyces harbinensis]